MDATALKGIVVAGSAIKADVAAAVTSFVVDETSTMITQADLVVNDPGFKILASGLFAKDATIGFSGLDLRVADVGSGGTDAEQLVVSARSRGAWALQQEKGYALGASEDDSDYTTYLQHAAERVGLGFHGQPPLMTGMTIVRTTEPGHLESTWDVGVQGAQEWGFLIFEARGVLYFGKPSWLLATTPKTLTVGWRGSAGAAHDSLTIPETHRIDGTDASGQAEASVIDVTVPTPIAAGVGPGDVLVFSGIPGFAGRYLVVRNTWQPGTVEPAKITATTPVDPYIDPTTFASLDDVQLPHVENTDGPFNVTGNVSLSELLQEARDANKRWPFIIATEKAFGLPAFLLFAVGSKETNLSAAYTQGKAGDHGHGHGVWQLDDRSHAIPAGFDTDVHAQCDKAAAMLKANLARQSGDLVKALNVYNSGQTLTENTTANYGPDVAERRQALETHASEWL